MRFKNSCATLSLLVSCFALSLPALAVTVNLSPGGNLTKAVETANTGDIIQLADGVYTPIAATTAFNSNATFPINKGITIRGNNANPAAVVLQASSVDYSVRFLSYADGTGGTDAAHGATLEGVTIQGSPYGVLVDNYTFGGVPRLTDITLRNIIINATGGGDGVVAGGVSLTGPQRMLIDNVTVNAVNGNGFNLRNTLDAVIMNSRVTTAGTALFVNGGQRNVVVNNTFGNVPALNGVTLGTSGVIFQNSQANRFERNTVQGFRTDGLVFFNTTSGDTTLQASDNYAGKNTIISNGFAATVAGVPSRDHGTGIWINCGANNSWVFGNDVTGGPEAGVTIWSSKSNMVLGNHTHDNEDGGLYVAGGTDVYSECLAAAYRIKSVSNTLQSNASYFNKLDNIIVRNADFTDVIMNFVSPTNGLGGGSQTCVNIECQSAFSLESPELVVNGSRVLRNTSLNNRRGLWVDHDVVVNMEFFGNRVIGSTNNRLLNPSGFKTLDWGSVLGGNHWSQHSVSGNPGNVPFTGISYNSSNNINGDVSDRFPYQSESFGITAMTVSEPFAGEYAIGSARTVRWNAPGCTYVDLLLDGSVVLKTNQPNTGYAVVTIPSTTLAAHNVQVNCRNAAGAGTGASANSPTFTVTSAELTLITPGRDDVFNASATDIPVAWKRSTGFTGAVTIEYSTNNGASYTVVPGTTTYAGSGAYVTMPAIAATQIRLRVRSGTAMDTTDGFVGIRGSSPGFTNVQAGRSFIMGRLERLEWVSPLNSRVATITYNTGSGVRTVVTDLPDRGSYDWIVPDAGTSANLVLTISFKTSTGTPISSVAGNTAATAYTGVGGPFTLSVTAQGSGTVTSSPAGINCPPACEAPFALNTSVTLSSAAGSGSSFWGYTGACTGTTCTVLMNASKGVVATYYTGTLITRYRLYSDVTFEHLYTTNLFEYNYLPSVGWLPEGAIYQLFQGPGTYGGVAAVPYYRLYSPFSFQHHWTTAQVEYDFLPSAGWNQESTDGYILTTPVGGAVPLYRLYANAAGGLHLWTTSLFERNHLIGTGGWVDEGIAGYVLPLPAP